MTEFSRPDWSPEKMEVSQRPNLLFPSGRSIFTDDFESPVIRWQDGSGSSSSIGLTTVYAREGNACLSLAAGAGGYPAESASATIELGLPTSKKIGIEFFFAMVNANVSYFEIDVARYEETTAASASIQWKTGTFAADRNWEYYNWGTATYDDLPGGRQNLNFGAYSWHQFKLILDFDANKYVSLNCDDLELDLSALTLQTSSGDYSEYVVLDFYAFGTVANAGTVLIDQFSITEED